MNHEKSIWYKPFTLQDLTERAKNTMVEYLGIEFTGFGHDFLTAEMPVDHRTKQPAGLLHGGASAAFAETLGSYASTLCVDREKFLIVGLEINANHIRAMREGRVFGKVTPLHIGRRTHVWDIKITNAEQKLVCTSRLTVAIVERGTV